MKWTESEGVWTSGYWAIKTHPDGDGLALYYNETLLGWDFGSRVERLKDLAGRFEQFSFLKKMVME